MWTATWTGAALLFGAWLAASGCGVASHSRSDPVPFERFCQELFDAVCEPLAACECGDAALSRCRMTERELCLGFPSPALVRAVEEGRLRYDGDAAAALLARLRDRSGACASFADAVDWRVRDLFSIGGVFEGTVHAGEPCEVLGFELISECALGSCAPVGDGRLCRAVVGEGASCDALHQCADLDAPVSTDTGIEQLSLRCELGTCVRRLADGAPCERDGECESTRCRDGRCRASALGEPCDASRQCASGYCDGSRRCAPSDAPIGASCDMPAACASRVCVAGVCLPAACGTF